MTNVINTRIVLTQGFDDFQNVYRKNGEPDKEIHKL